MTAFRTDCPERSCHQILLGLYTTKHSAKCTDRNAQHFMAKPKDAGLNAAVSIINVQVPSLTKSDDLTYPQRSTLFKHVLQSMSLIDMGKRTCEDNYTIAGDFNTSELMFPTLMKAIEEGANHKTFRQMHGEHGDMGFYTGGHGQISDAVVKGHE